MNIQTQRNLEMFVRLIEVDMRRIGKWQRCRDGATSVLIDILGESVREERVRITVSIDVAAPSAPDALMQFCSEASPRRTGGLPVRYFVADGKLAASACMPASSTARQWLPVFGLISQRMAGFVRKADQ